MGPKDELNVFCRLGQSCDDDQGMRTEPTVKFSVLNSSEDVPAINVDWSYLVMQILLLVVPKYLVGANAESCGSKVPISTIQSHSVA